MRPEGNTGVSHAVSGERVFQADGTEMQRPCGRGMLGELKQQ